MEESLSHTKWECKYHVVFIPKGRRKVLYAQLRNYLGDVFHQLARQKECRIVSFRQACIRGWADLFLGGLGRQKSPHRGAADLQAAGDLGFADPCAMQFPDLSSVDGGSSRSAEPFSILPRMSQASASSLPQNFPFELGEDRQQASHGSTGRRGQIQRLGQRDEADTQMFQFLQRRQQVRD